MKRFATFILFLTTLLSAYACADYASEMDQQTALNKINAGAITVIDVRSAEEFNAGHVPGALNIPHTEVEARLTEIIGLKNKPVLIYCRSGRRAGIAEETLSVNGFSDLHHLKGDMLEWSKNNLPIER